MSRYLDTLRSHALKRRYWVVLTIACLGAVLGRLSLPTQPIRQNRHLRVITFNIAGRMTDQRQLLALLKPQQADLILLQEVRHRRQLQWLAERLQLTHWRFAPYPGRFGSGVGILSRWPLGPPQVLTFQEGTEGRAALAASVDTPESTLWACSIHLESPSEHEFGNKVWTQGRFVWRELFAATLRYRQVVEWHTWLEQFPEHKWIVGGDFNTIPLSRVDRYMSRYFDDALLHHPWQYLTGTYWNLPALPFNPRIDFLYHSSDVRVIEAKVIRQRVSDHFPILSIFILPRTRDEKRPALHARTHTTSPDQKTSEDTSLLELQR